MRDAIESTSVDQPTVDVADDRPLTADELTVIEADLDRVDAALSALDDDGLDHAESIVGTLADSTDRAPTEPDPS